MRNSLKISFFTQANILKLIICDVTTILIQ